MKVYCSGVHGSGKTTLGRYISTTYQLPFIPEVARMILSETEKSIDVLRSNINEANTYQQSIFNRQFLEEQKYQEFVSDRSLIDTLAYAGSHSGILSELMRSSELVPYIENLRTKETIVFFVRPSKSTLKEDGVREKINWDGVISIDGQIKLLLELFDIPHIQINTDSMSERIRLITTVLDRLLAK